MGKPYENYEVIKDQRHIVLRCKICHEDTELWPDYIVMERYHYNNGVISCSCSASCRYTTEQQEVLVRRQLKGTGYKFLGFQSYPPKSGTGVLLECSICSKDSDLFQSGDIVANRYMIGKSKFCGCGYKYVWSERQNTLRVERKCKDLGLTFLGWDGEYKGVNTKVKLKDMETGFEYTASTIAKFLVWVTNDAVKFAQLPVGITSKGGIIKVVGFSGEKSGNNNKVLIECSICNEDKELFPNPFESTLWQIRGGKYPCLCNSGYKSWTKHEYEVRIRRRLEGLPVKWDGYLPEDACASTKLNLVCDKHPDHPWSTTCIDSLFRMKEGNYGCLRCAEGVNGHYETKTQDLDTLYVIMFDNSYIKVGRSFDINRRVEELKEGSGATRVEVLQTFQATHKIVYDCEQACHKHLKSLGYYHHESTWTVESFHKEAYDHAVTFITSYLKSHQ